MLLPGCPCYAVLSSPVHCHMPVVNKLINIELLLYVPCILQHFYLPIQILLQQETDYYYITCQFRYYYNKKQTTTTTRNRLLLPHTSLILIILIYSVISIAPTTTERTHGPVPLADVVAGNHTPDSTLAQSVTHLSTGGES